MYRSIFQISIALVIVDKALAGTLRPNRQVNHEVNSDQDRQQAETGLASAAIASGKYFQDMFSEMSAPHKIEFGHVCETPEDWEQRFERKDFKNNKHQGKVRWGDKHGGYGEHYWDYNHDGHDGHDGEESQNDPQYAKYEEEESQHNPQVQIAPITIEQPKYQQYLGRNRRQPEERPKPKNSRSFEEISEETQDSRNKRQPEDETFAVFPKFLGSELEDSKSESRGKRNPNLESDDVEFIDSRARSLVESGRAQKHGGNYRRLPGLERAKRGRNVEYSDFVYEPETGKMINQKTGDVFELTLIK